MKRLLVIDDDEAIRESLELALSSRFEVLLARDGRDGLALLERGEHVDLVLLDLMMPGMDGATFLTEARARGHRFPTLVISADQQHQAIAAGLGATSLGKPFDLDTLDDAVDRALAAAADQATVRR